MKMYDVLFIGVMTVLNIGIMSFYLSGIDETLKKILDKMNEDKKP